MDPAGRLQPIFKEPSTFLLNNFDVFIFVKVANMTIVLQNNIQGSFPANRSATIQTLSFGNPKSTTTTTTPSCPRPTSSDTGTSKSQGWVPTSPSGSCTAEAWAVPPSPTTPPAPATDFSSIRSEPQWHQRCDKP